MSIWQVVCVLKWAEERKVPMAKVMTQFVTREQDLVRTEALFCLN